MSGSNLKTFGNYRINLCGLKTNTKSNGILLGLHCLFLRIERDKEEMYFEAGGRGKHIFNWLFAVIRIHAPLYLTYCVFFCKITVIVSK